ncbi:MAG: glycosyltransferase family 9 protein [Ktedonobacteraceae bacterium]|nr:glycosyltransferase family 9 protein [Ktedonobacteraceae bacterium]
MKDRQKNINDNGVVPDIKKIAVLRANALGDLLFAMPALEALRTAYPSAEIVLLAKSWHADFLAHRPGPVDRVVVVPVYGGVSAEPGVQEDAGELEDFFARMQQEHFDLAIQMHGGGRYSNPFVRHLHARLTAGLKTPDALPLDRWIPYIYFQHEVLRYLEVVALVGAAAVRLEPRIAVTGWDLAEAAHVVSSSADRPLVALHPGASDPRRRWPTEKFARVGDALAEAGACVVVTGTADERDLAHSVIEAMHAPALDLSGRLSLGGLAGLFSRCRVVVANDTGPLHLAAAVGVPTVGIFWCYNLINGGPLTRRFHRPHASWRLLCPICGQDNSCTSCSHRVSFVSDVAVQDVVADALDLLCESVSAGSADERANLLLRVKA